ncbi:MAG: hypothetical protein ACOYBP_07330 [Microbacteriaceae bacterium]
MGSFIRTIAVFKLGVIAGFIAAHLINRTPSGRAFFADVDAKLRDFTDGVTSGYREREAQLRDQAL